MPLTTTRAFRSTHRTRSSFRHIHICSYIAHGLGELSCVLQHSYHLQQNRRRRIGHVRTNAHRRQRDEPSRLRRGQQSLVGAAPGEDEDLVVDIGETVLAGHD